MLRHLLDGAREIRKAQAIQECLPLLKESKSPLERRCWNGARINHASLTLILG